MTVLARGVGALMVLAVLAPARAQDDQAHVCRKIVDGLARQDIEAVVPLMALTAWTPAIREDGKAKIRQTLTVISRHMGGNPQSRHPVDLEHARQEHRRRAVALSEGHARLRLHAHPHGRRVAHRARLRHRHQEDGGPAGAEDRCRQEISAGASLGSPSSSGRDQ